MRRALAVLLLWGGHTLLNAFEVAALRELANLPEVDSNHNYGTRVDPFKGDGLYLIGPSSVVDGVPKATRQQVEQLRQQLKNEPPNARLCSELAIACGEIKDDTNSVAMFQRAAELYRAQWLRDRKMDVTRFVGALVALERFDQAEEVLTSALKTDPAAWKQWVQLGFLSHMRVTRDLGIKDVSTDLMAYEDSLSKRLHTSITDGQLQTARKHLKQSIDALKQAIIVAPTEPGAHLARAGMIVAQKVWGWLIEARQVKSTELFTNDAVAQMFEDYEKVAQLRPDDPGALATFVYVVTVTIGAAAGQPFGGFKLLGERQGSVDRALARLDEISNGPDANKAAASLVALGIFDFIFKQNPWTAERKLRRAVQIDPKCDDGWEALYSVLYIQQSFARVKGLSEQRVAVEPTPYTYVLLAKACAGLKQWDEAEAAIKDALRLGPEDPLSKLCMAALRIRRGKEKDSVAEALRLLDSIQLSSSGLSDVEQRDFILTRGIGRALAGQIADARTDWNEILRRDPKNEAAGKALALVAESEK